MIRSFIVIGAVGLALSAKSIQAQPAQYGPNPDLPQPERGLLPSMKIPRPANWDGELPKVPEGFTIRPIATDLQIPRQTIVLPNGDILVAEGSGGYAPRSDPRTSLRDSSKASARVP